MDHQTTKKQSPPIPQKPHRNQGRNNSVFWLLAILAAVIGLVYFSSDRSKQAQISYGTFRQALDEKIIAKGEIQGARVTGEFVKPPEGLENKFVTTLPPYPLVDEGLDRELREQLGKNYNVTEPTDSTFTEIGRASCRE